MELRALVVTGYGVNCERESKAAIEKSGGKADIMHLNRIIDGPSVLEDYNFLFLPGGFSFGDALGSGKVLSNKINFKLHYPLKDFVESGKLVMGVCNGFQVLVKMGLLPKQDFRQRVTLVGNESGKFEDRWVLLENNKNSPCIFTKGIDRLFLPIRHGEGKFVTETDAVLDEIEKENQVVLRYIDGNGKRAGYPYNPNGSVNNIAGICDKTGRIFGLMPHPEAFQNVENCPYWTTGKIKEAQGLKIFKNAVKYMEEKH